MMDPARVIEQQLCMKECDILWAKTYSDPFTYFQGIRTPNAAP